MDCVHRFKALFSLIPQVGWPHMYLKKKKKINPCSALRSTGTFSRKVLFVLHQNSNFNIDYMIVDKKKKIHPCIFLFTGKYVP